MILFYTENKKVMPIVEQQQEKKYVAICSSNCMKPKSKCCNKYQKKGINCKRCPLIYSSNMVS